MQVSECKTWSVLGIVVDMSRCYSALKAKNPYLMKDKGFSSSVSAGPDKQYTSINQSLNQCQ